MIRIRFLALLALAVAMPGCASYPPAPDNHAEICRIVEGEGLKCPPKEKIRIAFADICTGPVERCTVLAKANRDTMTITLDSRFRDEAWASGPHGYRMYAHELAHLSGADETTARSIGCQAWICGK